MNIFKALSYSIPLLLVAATPVFASIVVNSPVENADVSSPFKISASFSRMQLD